MKAKEWIAKFEAIPISEQSVEERFAEALNEYGEETAKLVAARTKTSTPSSKFSAAEGAVREQQSKFRAVAAKVGGLNDTVFENMLNKAIPEYSMWRAAASQKKTQEVVDDVKEYKNKRGRLLARK